MFLLSARIVCIPFTPTIAYKASTAQMHARCYEFLRLQFLYQSTGAVYFCPNSGILNLQKTRLYMFESVRFF